VVSIIIKMARVLLVEDDADLASVVMRGLSDAGFAVDLAPDGAQALEKAAVTVYDVILLDRDLPVVHGDDVCRQLVRDGNTARILMLTAAGDVSDRVDGLTLGADDYLAKPFAMIEVVARTFALSRRAASAVPTVLRVGDLELDPARRSVHRAGTELSLTRKELSVLEVLMKANGAVVSSEELLERVWDENVDPFTNAVRITMVTLRRKLGQPSMIETVIGSGYRIIEL
jgi:DNA-binding response OmpR family regulator